MPSPSSFFPISRMRILQLRHARDATGIICASSGAKEFPLPTLDVLYKCAHSNSAHWFDRGYYPRCVQSPAGGQVSAPSNTTKEDQNEDIAIYGCTLASATYCWVQQLPGGAGPRTSRTARTSWTDWRYGPDRRQGPHRIHRRHGPTRPDRRQRSDGTHRRHGPNRTDRRLGPNGTDRRPGCTRSGRTMSRRRASLYGPRFWKSELCQGLKQD